MTKIQKFKMTVDNDDKRKTWLLLVFLIIWAVLLLLTACSTEKKAQKKTAWLIAHDKLDDVCSRVYPNRDSTIYRDSISFDTLYLQNDVTVRDTVVKGDTLFVEKKCPPERVITETVHDSVFIYRTNTADVDRLKGDLLAKDKQIGQKDYIIIKQQEKIDKNDRWRVAAILTWCVVFTGFVFRFFVIKRPI